MLLFQATIDDIFTVPVDTTAADIAAISLPISNVNDIISDIIVNKPSISVSDSDSSTSSSGSSGLWLLPWISFSTSPSSYPSLFSSRPCLTVTAPQIAINLLRSFSLSSESITACFSMPPFF